MTLKVSIVIPTLDRPEMTLRAFESAMSQSWQDKEVLIVDNGSTTPNLAMMRGLGLNWVTERIRGAGAARNAGISATTGELIIFLDSDDELIPRCIENLVNNLLPATELIYGGVVNINDSKEAFVHAKRLTFAPLLGSSLVRRSAFDTFGFFEDGNFSWISWYLKARDSGLSEQQVETAVVRRHIHDGNLSRSEDSYREYYKLIRKRIADGNAG